MNYLVKGTAFVNERWNLRCSSALRGVLFSVFLPLDSHFVVCYYILFLLAVILWTFCSESIKRVALCLLCATLLELVLAHTLYVIQKTSQKVTCGIGNLWERDLDVSLTSLRDYLKLCESSTCRHENWDLFGWQWFLGARTNKKKHGNAHWPHSCNLTFDKPQVSCLELPSWCVTQPHLAKAVSCDIFTISLHTTPHTSLSKALGPCGLWEYHQHAAVRWGWLN